MRQKVLIIVVSVIFILITSLIYMQYPQKWKTVKIGMLRQQMMIELGESLSSSIYEFKGDVYTHEVPIGWYRMDVFTDSSNHVYSKYIHLYIGTKANYWKLNCIE